MRRQVITDNSVEKLEIVKEDELYGLVHFDKNMYPEWRNKKTIVLNSKEALEVADFIKNVKNLKLAGVSANPSGTKREESRASKSLPAT